MKMRFDCTCGGFWMPIASFLVFSFSHAGGGVKADIFGNFQYFPQRADQICENLIQSVYDAYPQFEMTCGCSGAPLITDPSTGTVTPLGDFFVQCMSKNFFTSPDGKVWWHLYWSAKFNDGLESITQECTYVRGRKYDDRSNDKNDLYRERFTYLPKELDRCGFRQISNIGNYLSCDVCERITSINPNVSEDTACYKIDCTNLANSLFIRSPTFAIEDTCSVPMPITDFENEPLAASLSFLEDYVPQVYYPGGEACIGPLTTIWDSVQEDLDCTCEPADGVRLDEDEAAVFVSCQIPCVYGPESGEVEFLLYFEWLFKHTGVGLNPRLLRQGGTAVWVRQRSEYITGREGVETFREEGDSCFVTRSDDVACDCSFDSDSVLLDCANGDSFVFNRYETQETEESWTTMPFAARWKQGSVCLRPTSSEVPDDPSTPSPTVGSAPTILFPTTAAPTGSTGTTMPRTGAPTPIMPATVEPTTPAPSLTTVASTTIPTTDSPTVAPAGPTEAESPTPVAIPEEVADNPTSGPSAAPVTDGPTSAPNPAAFDPLLTTQPSVAPQPNNGDTSVSFVKHTLFAFTLFEFVTLMMLFGV